MNILYSPQIINTWPTYFFVGQNPILLYKSIGLLCKQNSSSWIFDCEAIYTMTYDPSEIKSTVPIDRKHIRTANGECVSVARAKTVDISRFINLKNCLLVPNLSHKLLYISQLTKELNCTVLLTFSIVVLWRMLKLGQSLDVVLNEEVCIMWMRRLNTVRLCLLVGLLIINCGCGMDS